MTDDPQQNELAELWNRQEHLMHLGDPSKVTASLQQRRSIERRKIVRLNVQELIPSIGLFIIFTWIGLVGDGNRWPYFSAGLICLGVGLFLLSSSVKQHRTESRFDSSIRGELERSLSQVTHRERLFRSVGWWYLAPLTVAIALVYLPTRLDSPNGLGVFDAVYGIGGLALMTFLFRLNRRSAAEQYEPEVRRYRALLADLDDSVAG